MTSKHAKIAARFAARADGGDSPYHACYLEYFRLFNAGDYYEAHDVLEHIWLRAEGEIRDFYKALIQLAGAFVHMQHHHREPQHRVHGRRLRPAERLLRLSAQLLEPFAPRYEGLDVDKVRALALRFADVASSGRNPWSPETAPRIDGPS